MRELEFWKISPSGNPTILVPVEALSQEEQDQPRLRAQLANALMQPLHVGAEQVGFIYRAEQSLDMMGGEFCLNATRAFAALLFEKRKERQEEGAVWESELRVSGVDMPVAVRVQAGAGGPEQKEGALPYAAAALTFAQLPPVESLEKGISRVVLPGITHIILEEPMHSMPMEEAAWRAQAYGLCEKYGLGAAAVGCLWLQARGSDWELKPVVLVQATQSLFYESACGSGTLACGLYLQAKGHGQELRILQPSGDFLSVVLEAQAGAQQKMHKAMWRIWVAGPVRICAHGTAFLA